MTHNQLGGFSFLGAPGRPFSSGVAADPGFDITHVVLTPPVPLKQGFELVRRHLEEVGRPLLALCGMELRIPSPLSPEGFEDFNRGYVESLDRWELRVEGMLPPARTNVALVDGSVKEASLFAFSYTVREPALSGAYLMAGAPEPEGAPDTAEGRLASIVEVLGERMQGLGVRFDQATAANFYAEEGWTEAVASSLLPAFGGGAATVQLTWVAAVPPVSTFRFEVDVRRCGKELAVVTGPVEGS